MKPTIQRQEQLARVELERPVDGVPIPTESKYELAAYRMPNGSRFVTLADGSDATWEAYAAEFLTLNEAKAMLRPTPKRKIDRWD